jgi:serine/threonine protein kinase
LTKSQSYNHDQPNLPLSAESVLQGRYRIVRLLGRGGMGAVYEAIDQRLGITVALKETLSAEESMRKQFEREARLLAGMHHPALPRVSDHFVEGNRAFLVMQFIGGVDLAKIIAQQPGPFPRDQVIAWADQLLDALIYLHSRDRQVIHRDIKPHNLKLTAARFWPRKSTTRRYVYHRLPGILRLHPSLRTARADSGSAHRSSQRHLRTRRHALSFVNRNQTT